MCTLKKDSSTVREIPNLPRPFFVAVFTWFLPEWKWFVKMVLWFDENYFEPEEKPFHERPRLHLNDSIEKINVHLDPKALEIYSLYREKVVHEDTLVNWRTTWFVALQAFLFTALALSQGKFGELQLMANLALSCLGVVISIASFVSIVAAKEAVNKTVRKWRSSYKDPIGERYLERGVRDYIDPLGVLPAIKGAGSSSRIGLRGNLFSFIIPPFIGIFWIVIVAISFYLEMPDVESNATETSADTDPTQLP